MSLETSVDRLKTRKAHTRDGRIVNIQDVRNHKTIPAFVIEVEGEKYMVPYDSAAMIAGSADCCVDLAKFQKFVEVLEDCSVAK